MIKITVPNAVAAFRIVDKLLNFLMYNLLSFTLFLWSMDKAAKLTRGYFLM